MAAVEMDKVDRSLYELYEDVTLWAGLEVMQEVVTGDLDGRISSFLMAADKQHGDFVTLDVVDERSYVVASSHPDRIGHRLANDPAFPTVMSGEPVVRDIEKDERTGTWVVLFYWPIRARFDESATVGALCATWSAAELETMTRDLQQAVGRPTGSQVVLMRADGVTLSAPSSAALLFEENLSSQASTGAPGQGVQPFGRQPGHTR